MRFTSKVCNQHRPWSVCIVIHIRFTFKLPVDEYSFSSFIWCTDESCAKYRSQRKWNSSNEVKIVNKLTTSYAAADINTERTKKHREDRKLMSCCSSALNIFEWLLQLQKSRLIVVTSSNHNRWIFQLPRFMYCMCWEIVGSNPARCWA